MYVICIMRATKCTAVAQHVNNAMCDLPRNIHIQHIKLLPHDRLNIVEQTMDTIVSGDWCKVKLLPSIGLKCSFLFHCTRKIVKYQQRYVLAMLNNMVICFWNSMLRVTATLDSFRTSNFNVKTQSGCALVSRLLVLFFGDPEIMQN